jgi:hypothetical protein
MQEALIAFVVLVVGVVVGLLLKPNEAQLRPLYPDEINVPGAVHAEEHGHGHHH